MERGRGAVVIKELRIKSGMTQEQLAEMLGVTQGAVAQWEKGLTHPAYETLPKLAKVFGVTVDDLFRKVG